MHTHLFRTAALGLLTLAAVGVSNAQASAHRVAHISNASPTSTETAAKSAANASPTSTETAAKPAANGPVYHTGPGGTLLITFPSPGVEDVETSVAEAEPEAVGIPELQSAPTPPVSPAPALVLELEEKAPQSATGCPGCGRG